MRTAMSQGKSATAYKMPAFTVTAIIVYITLLKGVFGGVPLPEVCLSRRGDRNAPDTISRDCTNTERVHRFFFSARRLRCKKFSLCPSLAVYLDEQCDADNNLNYFQSRANCEESCINVVECFLEPLNNGYPVIHAGEGERLGYGAKVTYACNEGFRLVEQSTRVCQLYGAWNGTQPHCEIQCLKPEVETNVSLSPSQLYYDIGQKVLVECMDGNTTWTCKEDVIWEGPDPTCSPSCTPQIIDNAYPPEMKLNGSSLTYTYQCNEGYMMLHNSSTLHCINGQLHGDSPICTRVQIKKEDGMPLNVKNDTFYFSMVKGTANSTLTCSLDGIGESEYNVNWMLPKKPNGEVPPGVTSNENTLTFLRAVPEQSGMYICTTAGKNTTVIVDVVSLAMISQK